MATAASTFSLRYLALLLTLLSIGARVQSATTINFALIWKQPDLANITETLFQRIFLPRLIASCPARPGINDTQFVFTNVSQVGLFDIGLANQKLRDLQADGCLFAGAEDFNELDMFSSASVRSGVLGYAGMSTHVVAPMTLLMAMDGVVKVLNTSFRPSTTVTGNFDDKLVIVLGTGYSLEEVNAVLDVYPGLVLFFRLELGKEHDIIDAIRASKARNFFLASSAAEADIFLAAAFDSLLLIPSYRWFLFNVRLVDKNNFAGFKVVSMNITSMEFGPISIAIDHKLIRAKEIYAYDLLSIWNQYLMKIVCGETGEVNTTYVGMTGDFSLFPNGTVVRKDWRMNFYGGLGTERQRIGVWTSSGEFRFDPPPNRVVNDETVLSELKRNSFRVVTLLEPPFVQYNAQMQNVSNATMYDKLEGFAIDICKELLMNLSIANVTFFLQADNQFGSQDGQGNWSGLVRTLIQGKADMACANLSPSISRAEVVKFTQPYLSYQLSILYVKRLENPLIYMFEFLRPFHQYTWAAVLGSVVVLSLVLAVLHRLSRNAVSFSLYETIFFSFASLIQGITGTPPDRPSGQLVIAIYWLFAFVVLVAYVTNYAASRTLSRLQSDIDSLSTLYSQSLYEYGTVNSTSYLAMMQNSTDTTQPQIYRYIIADPTNRMLPNSAVALELVRNGSFAFIYDSILNHYHSQSICNSVNTGVFSSQSVSLGMPITAEYYDMVNTVTGSLIISGRRDILYNKYFSLPTSQLPHCRSTEFPDLLRDYIPTDPAIFKTKSGALTLHNTLGIAVINLVGCALTLLLATVEFLYLRCRRWQRKRRLRAEQERAQMIAVPKLTSDLDQLESTA